TLSAILTSDALLRRLGPKLNPPVSAKELRNYIDFVQERSADFVELNFNGAHSAEDAVHNVNTWGEEIVNFTKELQSRETQGTRVYLQRESVEENINPTKAERTALRSQYSDGNPLVREKVAQIDW